MPRKFTMKEFQQELEDLYLDGITAHGRKFNSIAAWRSADPIAFREEYNNWLDSHGRYR